MKAMSIMCHVTVLQGVIQNHIFGISDPPPNLPFHYLTFTGYDDD